MMKYTAMFQQQNYNKQRQHQNQKRKKQRNKPQWILRIANLSDTPTEYLVHLECKERKVANYILDQTFQLYLVPYRISRDTSYHNFTQASSKLHLVIINIQVIDDGREQE